MVKMMCINKNGDTESEILGLFRVSLVENFDDCNYKNIS